MPTLLSNVEQMHMELHLRTRMNLCHMSQLTTLIHHLVGRQHYRVYTSLLNPGFSGTLRWSAPPNGLEEAGFNTKHYCCTEIGLIRANTSEALSLIPG